jgi:hypothetical protein
VTAGGWTEEGWRSSTGAFFVPYDKLRHRFRDRLVILLQRGLTRHTLAAPAGMDAVTALLQQLGTVDWHVRVMDRYGGGQGVLTYFSRYVRGGPISNPQITHYDGKKVMYRYYRHETGACGRADLSVDEFIRRLLEHVPEKGFRMVRYYGLFAPSRRAELARCRALLGMAPYQAPDKLTVEAYLARFHVEVVTTCPVCGQRLLHRDLLPVRTHDPPVEAHRYARVA